MGYERIFLPHFRRENVGYPKIAKGKATGGE
jgi:hypothetical protein